MKQSDLEFLLKLENSTTNNHKRLLQGLLQEKQQFIDRLDALNTSFLVSKPDIHAAGYLRFRAIENQRIQRQINDIDNQITITQENIRDSIREEKKYDILKQDIINANKKKFEKHQENQSQEYTVFQYSKPNTLWSSP
jgi:hypothetical protein